MSDINSEFFEMLDNCERSIRALKEVAIKLINGEPNANVLLEQLYDNALFKESYSSRRDDCITEVGIIIERLLELRLSANVDHKVLIDSIRPHMETLYGYTKWGNKHSVKRLIDPLVDSIDECYDYGVGRYKRDAKKYTDLQYRMDEIPEECPWTLGEIMDLDPEELISDKFFKNGGEE